MQLFLQQIGILSKDGALKAFFECQTIFILRRPIMAKTSVSQPGNPYHSTGGNFPSKTGNPSGGNRGNNPPSR